MGRLEAVEVQLSELERTRRIDSEFFQKENLHITNTLNLCKIEKLTNLVDISDGNHMEISSKFQETGIPYFRGQDIHSFFIEMANAICIDEKTYNLPYMKRSHLKNNDVLLSIVGTIGKVAIFSGDSEATCNCKLAILRKKNINPEFLSIFLKSKYGNNQIVKYTRGAVQMGFILEDMQQVKVPIFSDVFVDAIKKCVITSKNKIKLSEDSYTSAQTLLLSELGLADYTPSSESVAVKSFAASFGVSGRLDAEYYQPKYEAVERKISKFKHDTLGKLVSMKKSIEPGSEYYGNTGVPFIRVSNLSKFEISEPDIKLPFDTVQNISGLFPKRDTILLTKDGSVGIAYKVIEDMDCVTSGAILHLNINNQTEILPDYLTLVLNSIVVQFQAERDAGGSIIQHWKPSEIEQVIIPVLDMDIQKQITEKIQQSFALRKKSAELLDCAKQAVEMAIEQGEDVASMWLEERKQNRIYLKS